MGRPKGAGLLRPTPLTLRLTRDEKRLIKKKATEQDLSMVEYVRRHIFDANGRLVGDCKESVHTS